MCYFISPSGEIAGKYIKKNLWGPERDHLTGSGHSPHARDPVKVNLLIREFVESLERSAR